MDMTQLFRQHCQQLQATTEKALAATGFDALYLGAGSLRYHFEDDQSFAFRPAHHFAHWCPAQGEEHVLVIRPGQKPVLKYFAPSDFWHEFAPLGSPYWRECLDVEEYPTVDALWASIQAKGRVAFLGPQTNRALAAAMVLDSSALLHQLNWYRSYKSPYEVAMSSEANRIGALGHIAAREAFLAGGSELDIHYAFVRACRATDDDLAYNTIIALNEKGATLHYHHKRDDVRNGSVLLIDAGYRHMHYNSDITRTYAVEAVPAPFKAMLRKLDYLQRSICDSVRPGRSFADLHEQAHLGIASILTELGMLRELSPEAVIAEGLTRPFFPHGLGHMLGIFVHDVAGTQKDPEGSANDPSKKFPTLRTTRQLDVGHLITVEPGFYFIPMLLAPMRSGKWAKHFDWPLIDALTPFGGARIEDDVLVQAEAPRNLTREYLPD